jgi:hypothetical protein
MKGWTGEAHSQHEQGGWQTVLGLSIAILLQVRTVWKNIIMYDFRVSNVSEKRVYAGLVACISDMDRDRASDKNGASNVNGAGVVDGASVVDRAGDMNGAGTIMVALAGCCGFGNLVCGLEWSRAGDTAINNKCG